MVTKQKQLLTLLFPSPLWGEMERGYKPDEATG
jgi:hypothetical protein